MDDRQQDGSRRSSGTFKRFFSKSERRASIRTPPDSRGSPIPPIPEGNEPLSPVTLTESYYPIVAALDSINSFADVGAPISAPLKATCDAIQALMKTTLVSL
jgi:hypothetical protein